MLTKKDIKKIKLALTSFEVDHPGKEIKGYVARNFLQNYLGEKLLSLVQSHGVDRVILRDIRRVLENRWCAHCKNVLHDSVCPACKSTPEGYLSAKNVRKQRTNKTCQELYGCDYTFQSEEQKVKTRKTLLERYGVDNAAKAKEVQQQIKATCLERYGLTTNLLLPEAKEAQIKKCIEKYGTPYRLQSKKGRKEFEEKLMELYGAPHAMQNEELLQERTRRNVERWGKENNTQLKEVIDQRRANHFEKHGVIHHMQRPEILRKFFQPTAYEVSVNGTTYECQGYERFLIPHLVKQFGKRDVLTQFHPKFPVLEKFSDYTPDIYIKSKKQFIEVKSTWYLLGNTKNSYLDINRYKNSKCRKLGINLVWVVSHNGKEFIQLPSKWDLWETKKLLAFLEKYK